MFAKRHEGHEWESWAQATCRLTCPWPVPGGLWVQSLSPPPQTLSWPPKATTTPHLVEFLEGDGLKEVAVVVGDPHSTVVGMQRVALLRLDTLAQLQAAAAAAAEKKAFDNSAAVRRRPPALTAVCCNSRCSCSRLPDSVDSTHNDGALAHALVHVHAHAHAQPAGRQAQTSAPQAGRQASTQQEQWLYCLSCSVLSSPALRRV